ncbi:MAG: AraC family transcriptional regulator [Anaerolineae bacterium]
MSEIQQYIYLQRVNLVLDYINTHLCDELTLKKLADVAGFSEYHFHRIFKAVTEETVSQVVWRTRVERGAALLRADKNLQISDAAIRCGFDSLAGFSRAFKTRFGLSPTQWDRQTRLQDEERILDEHFPVYHIADLQSCDEHFDVHFRHLEAQQLAYIRVYEPFLIDGRISNAYQRLINWYLACGGRLEDTTLYGMSMDDRDITPEHLCRFDWCLRVPDHWTGDDEISVRYMPSCKVAAVTMDGGDLRLEDRIWQYLWRHWLPRSNYKPIDLPAMEIYKTLPHRLDRQADGWWDHFYLDCAIPVTRLE